MKTITASVQLKKNTGCESQGACRQGKLTLTLTLTLHIQES
jgi:hypothetical protein